MLWPEQREAGFSGQGNQHGQRHGSGLQEHGAEGCRTGGAGMQGFPHWAEDAGQDLIDSGE